MKPTRREFLKSTAMAGAAVATVGAVPSLFAAEKSPSFRISLAQWSLNRQFFGGKIDALDFAKVAKEDYDIDAIEYVNQFFKDKAKDAKYIGELKKRAKDHGVKSLLIMVDGEGQLGSPDKNQRKKVVDNHKKWVEAAAELGCHSIRVNAASAGTYEEQIGYAADGLASLTQFAESLQKNVIVENHGGYSSNGKWLSAVMRTVDHPHCGTLPDFGNFKTGNNEWYDRYQGVEELMPFAKAVSAKSHDFDDEGNDTQTDFKRMMKIVLDAGYNGYVGIEYEGHRIPAPEGIKATKRLLERVRDELAKEKA